MTQHPFIRDSQGNVRRGETIEGPLSLPVSSGRVDQCCLDYAFSLGIDASGEWWVLRIEGTFAVASPAAAAERFEPAGKPGECGPAVDAVLHKTLADGSVTAEGLLTLTFADGTELEVQPSQQWEAWTLNGPREQLIVCGPGGQLSKWPEHS